MLLASGCGVRQGLSQEALAARCQRFGWDISRATLSKIEAGLRCVSDAEVVLLAAVLKCAVAELLPKNARVCLEFVAR
jgi:transcriptional regulator with XRE-family HTH domain